MDLFEVGVIYRKESRLYLAVSEGLLITFRNGRPVEKKPHARYEAVRSISVDELCARWKIELEDLDAMTAHYLIPENAEARPHPRGSRRKKADEDYEWQKIRSGRIAKPA